AGSPPRERPRRSGRMPLHGTTSFWSRPEPCRSGKHQTQMPGPLFIVLEGIDGSGTTTQLGRLGDHLTSRGRRAHTTREPSAGPVGRLLREILLGGHRLPDGAPADRRAMALLFAADGRDHLRREIEPALAAGTDVVCDRYLLSSLAYQGEEAERDWVAQLAREGRAARLALSSRPPRVAAASI